MAVADALRALIEERDRLNRAIEILQRGVAPKRRGRPPGSGKKVVAKKRGRPPMSDAEKKAASERMKELWAARRKAAKEVSK